MIFSSYDCDRLGTKCLPALCDSEVLFGLYTPKDCRNRNANIVYDLQNDFVDLNQRFEDASRNIAN